MDALSTSPDLLPAAIARPRRRGRRILALLALAAAFAAAVEGAGRVAEGMAVAAVEAEARSALPLAASALRAEIDRQRAVTVVLAEESVVRSTLVAANAANVAAANGLLARLAEGTGASVLYLVDAGGLAVAASNHARPDSFVGTSYRFRQYFARALATGSAEQYALGTVSRRPGLYIARRVGPAAAPLGVVVAKAELDRVEAEWRRTGRAIFAADGRGIVLSTSVPDWRFRTVVAVPPGEVASYRDSLQSAGAPLTPIPVERDHGDGDSDGLEGLVRAAPDGTERRYVAVSGPVDGGPAGWRLGLLAPADAAIRSAGLDARLLAALSLLLAGALLAVARRRQTREARRREALARANALLEARVAERTGALTQANRRLRLEMEERSAAEARGRRLADDLAQANRLATLGQITAGVAHEINQPLAAIRTYAENAGRFLDAGEPALARANMGTVVGLTERIGAITQALRGLARRGPRPREPVRLAAALDGALLMLGARMAESGVTLVVDMEGAEDGDEDGDGDGDGDALCVEADRLQLEQVLVNLLRNALDALRETPAPRIAVEGRAAGGMARLTVRDNGPGLSAEQRERLFTPFSTSKPDGLGLGLVISQDIVTALGGRLSAECGPGPAGGAAFTIELPRGAGPGASP